ncbi:MAG: permease [Deltaproteobacteria bacterium]|nr:permease [Deltaproteobacteria bacterium]
MRERTKLIIVLAVFAACWHLPGGPRVTGPLQEGFELVRWYAREHVILCLVPALFIAGAISAFVSQGAVMKYLGHGAMKLVAYPVAATSGTILAVCSCTVLPLFASIHKRGAGLGPATAFLYSGPAINVLAVVLTARVLGLELGIARAVGAVLISVVIGLIMSAIYRKEEAQRAAAGPMVALPEDGGRALWQDGLYFASMVGLLVFANLSGPEGAAGPWATVLSLKWFLTAACGAALALIVALWFKREEMREWIDSTWFFAKQILPLLLVGVLVAGLLLGGPGEGRGGIIPAAWVERLVGGNSPWANLFASVAGALMYFATLTEVPILEGLLAAGMGKGPALALLLAGPALSLPNMLVIRSVIGTQKTAVYVGLVVVFSTLAGVGYGAIAR